MNAEAKITQCLDGLIDIQKYLAGMPIQRKTIGQQLIDHKDFSSFNSGTANLITLNLKPHEIKTAITGGFSANDTLRPSFTPIIDPGKRRPIKIRDLLPTFPTTNGAIEMPIKTAVTIGSPAVQNGENTAFGESAYTFTTSFIPVETIGHFVPVSTQIFEDAGSLDATINTELLHGLADTEQDQLLNGDGTGHQLTGLIDNATAYTLQSPNLTKESDILRDAIKQVQNAEFAPNAIILNPSDWYDIDTAKAGASDDAYTSGQPSLLVDDKHWRLPIVVTTAISSGTFLVGDFNRAAVLFDRQEPQVQIARHDGTNFQKGMLTIRATERVALVVTNSTALVTGSL